MSWPRAGRWRRSFAAKVLYSLFNKVRTHSITEHPLIMGENISDIHIGETERIHWIEFDTSSNDLFDVDYIVNKYEDFWTSLQIFCVPECCGLDAFRFYPEDIVSASNHISKEGLKQDLVKLKLDLCRSDKDIIISSRLNNLIDKTVFVKLSRRR